ncbi:hypothetical protein EDB92DRAFT_2108023 [Lactarius akahatsu]|uniref:ABM domain-containing protein n=1 Tax=Lactarius akahatsu TaxID=416441 RepID=A0AAD4L6B1_9AGAM|nr:hypothetical protein EDB92DRAFT_2108023 [Lactarius akahatsu]
MAPEDPIVEVIQFVSTEQCLGNPSLFQALRDIVQGWQEKGLKVQYWGTTMEKPNNIYWVLFWQSRAHAAAFAADPLYPEFVQRRQSLATTPVRDLYAPLSGDPQLCVEAPVTDVAIFKAHEARIEKMHETAHSAVHLLRSLQLQGFTGSSLGVTHEDPSVGIYFSGWNSVEDHMRIGMEEGHEKLKEEGEEFMKQLSDLIIVHVDFKKHDCANID